MTLLQLAPLIISLEPETEVVLHNLPKGRLQTAVRAKNRAGTGPLSNVITVVV